MSLQPQLRVAFDIGSGATKMMVAEVVGTSVRQVHFGQEVPVPFAIEWKKSADGCLDEAIQQRGLEALRTLLDTAKGHGMEGMGACCAVSTEVFRKAANGTAYLERVQREFGLEVEVVTQSVEAELGFRTAVALQDGPPESVICWDSGGASFQITALPSLGTPPSAAVAGDEAPLVDEAFPLLKYVGTYGTGVVTALLVEEIQGQCFAETPTPNPVSAEEAERLMKRLSAGLPETPPWLQDSVVTAIGGVNSMFAVAAQALDVAAYTATDVRRALEGVVGLSDEDMAPLPFCQGELREPAAYIVPKLALLLAVMTHCGMREVKFCPAIGSCPGLLIDERRYAAAAAAAGSAE